MSKELLKSPKTQSEIAKELWEIAKQEDGWPDEMRMAYIMGACDGLRKMQEMLHPFKVEGSASSGTPSLLKMIDSMGRS